MIDVGTLFILHSAIGSELKVGQTREAGVIDIPDHSLLQRLWCSLPGWLLQR